MADSKGLGDRTALGTRSAALEVGGKELIADSSWLIADMALGRKMTGNTTEVVCAQHLGRESFVEDKIF